VIKMYCPKCGKENPEGARFCMHCGADLRRYRIENIEEKLRESYPEEEVQKFVNSIRIVMNIRSNYCNTSTKLGKIVEALDLLKTHLKDDDDFINAIEDFLKSISFSFRNEWEALEQKDIEELEHFCEKFIEMVIVKSLDVSEKIQRLREMRIPDKEEAIVEIVKEFNKTLQTIGIPNRVEPEKSLNLTPVQKEVARIVEDKVKEALVKAKKPVGDLETYLRLGIYELDLKNYDKALDYFEKALERDSNNLVAWFGRGCCYVMIKENEKALMCYDRVLEIDPNNASAWNGKGFALNDLGRYEEAIKCFDMALEMDSKVAVAWAGKGFAFVYLRRYKEAIRYFDRAIEIDPKDARVWRNKGSALVLLERYEEAIRCFDKASEINPKDVFVWTTKGITHCYLKNHEEALKCCDRALEIDSNFAPAWIIKGISLVELSRLSYKEGKRYYDACDYRLAKKKLYEHKELLESALASFRRALELNPNDDFVRKRIENLQEMLSKLREIL